MLLFKPEHQESIRNGVKTQTRRIWKRSRCKIGSIHKAKTVMLSKEYFAKLKILDCHREEFHCITEEDAKAEGGYTRAAYIEKFFEINPKIDKITCHGQVPFNVWVVEFELA
jgi:hypothetical protein